MSSRYRELLLVICVLAMAACHREERRFFEPATSAGPSRTIVQSENIAGARPTPVSPPFAYESNAHAISQGKQLYEWFNCTGCHAFGGGAIGPPLMDDQWIYGSAPENIYATIVEGRPNGMPSFGGRIPEQQVWQIVAYVRSLSGHVRKDADPSRSDHLFTRKSESSLGRQEARGSSPPPQPAP